MVESGEWEGALVRLRSSVSPHSHRAPASESRRGRPAAVPAHALSQDWPGRSRSPQNPVKSFEWPRPPGRRGGDLPGRQRPEGGAEAGDAPLPPLPERLLHELGLGGGVYPPKGPLPGLLLGARDLNEVAVQREVVADGILWAKQRESGHGGSDPSTAAGGARPQVLSTAAGRARPQVRPGEASSGAGGRSLGKDRGFTVVFLVKIQHRLTTTPYTGSET